MRILCRLTAARRDGQWEAAAITEMKERICDVPTSCRVLKAESLSGAVTPIDTAKRRSATRGMPWLSAYLRWKSAADGRTPAVLRES
jgi:hypothetical protein